MCMHVHVHMCVVCMCAVDMRKNCLFSSTMWIPEVKLISGSVVRTFNN